MYSVMFENLSTNEYACNIVLSDAIKEALKNDKNYKKYLKMYIEKYKDKVQFPNEILKWYELNEKDNINVLKYISSVGEMLDNEADVVENAKNVTMTMTNSLDAIVSAIYMSLIIFYSKKGISKETICWQLDLKLKYKKSDNVKDKFYNILYKLFNANSFEEAIKVDKEDVVIMYPLAKVIYGIPECIDKNNAISNKTKVYKRD